MIFFMLHEMLAALVLTSWQAQRSEHVDLCAEAQTTLEIEQCLAREIDRAEHEMNRYLAEVRRLFGSDTEAMASLTEAQAAWDAFVKADCRAVYDHWRGGTIRGPMFGGCRLDHAERRTHDLWETYLRGMVTDLREPSASSDQ